MKKSRLIIGIGIFLICCSIMINILKFHSDTTKTANPWSVSSDLLNQILTILNLVIFLWLSLEIYFYNLNRDKQNENFEKTIERPILIVKSISADTSTGESWIVQNIGNGAAMNIKVAHTEAIEIKWELPIMKCYSLGKGDTLHLPWLLNPSFISVLYEDIFNNQYATVVSHDECHIQPLSLDYRQIVTNGVLFGLDDLLAINSAPSIRFHKLKSFTEIKN